jgi:hypothetical protein
LATPVQRPPAHSNAAVGNPWLSSKEVISPKAVAFTRWRDKSKILCRLASGHDRRDWQGRLSLIWCAKFPKRHASTLIYRKRLRCDVQPALRFPDCRILLYGEPGCDDAAMGDYAAVLLPNFELPRAADNSVDLFLNFRPFGNALGHAD